MKNKIKEVKQNSSATHDTNQRIYWKIVAISVMLIFLLIVIGVLIKVYHYRSSLTKPTQAQTDEAARIATKKLQSMGDNVSAFKIHVGTKIRSLNDNGVPRKILQVSFANNATSHTFLIDISKGEILLHSETEVYVAFGERQNKLLSDEHFELGGGRYKGLKAQS